MAEERLNYKVTADTKGFVKGMKQVNSAQKAANVSTKNSGRSLTQLAYALDDAQLGQVKFSQSIRGMQNNIQALAVQAGAGGPLVLAITAATAAIGYFAKKWEEAKDDTEDAVDDIVEDIRKIQKELGIDTQEDPVTKLISNYRKLISEAEKEVKRLEGKVAVQSGELVTVGSPEQIKKAQDKVRELEKKLQRDITRIRDLESAKRNKKTVEGFTEEYKKLQKELKKLQKPTAGPKGKAQWLVDPNMVAQAQKSVDRYLESIKNVGLTQDELAFNKFKKDIEDVNLLFDKGIISLDEYIKRLGALSDTFTSLNEKEAEAKASVENLNGAFESALTGAITQFATTLGEALTTESNLGEGLMKTIGALMVAFGTALIAWGVGWKMFKEAPANPIGTIVAGVLLVAAGAAIASVASKAKSVGGNRGGGSSGGFKATFVAPRHQQGNGNGNGVIGVVRGNDIRYVLQGANNSYSARN